MNNEDKKALDEMTLKAVTGGKRDLSKFTTKRDEFEKAWKKTKMESKGFSGMAKAEMFDKWESDGYDTDATTFLLNI